MARLGERPTEQSGLYFGAVVSGRYSSVPLATERLVVPDGAPCPIHDLPTRLLFLPGVGGYSQCDGCTDDFLRWFYRVPAALDQRAPLVPASSSDPQTTLGL